MILFQNHHCLMVVPKYCDVSFQHQVILYSKLTNTIKQWQLIVTNALSNSMLNSLFIYIASTMLRALNKIVCILSSCFSCIKNKNFFTKVLERFPVEWALFITEYFGYNIFLVAQCYQCKPHTVYHIPHLIKRALLKRVAQIKRFAIFLFLFLFLSFLFFSLQYSLSTLLFSSFFNYFLLFSLVQSGLSV